MTVKSRSMHDVNEEAKARHKTLSNTYDMFPIGSRVMIVCVCQDFHFFEGKEIGTVVANSHKYLGIHVVFDKKQYFCKSDRSPNGRGDVFSFNFDPTDLMLLQKETDCAACHYLLAIIQENISKLPDKKKVEAAIDLLKGLY